jgi:hypothetical protein
VNGRRPGAHGTWDFPYDVPVGRGDGVDPGDASDVVVATTGEVTVAEFREALGAPHASIEPLIARAPLFWTRIVGAGAAIADMTERFERAGIAVRYVSPARTGSMALPPPLGLAEAPVARPKRWRVKARVKAAKPAQPTDSPGTWFLRADGGGIRVDRRICGTGAGTRLAVIDDETADIEKVELDRIVLVGIAAAPATTGHAALMTGWAVGAAPVDDRRFAGVAPDASARLYCIPKPGIDVVSLPLAIARAAFDGADVIVCATYVEGSTSPMMDDALEAATRLGRAGRGAVVLFPTGRETSSGSMSVHASLSLGLGDPASDPRIHCVAPGGREGGWFLWRTPRGKLRPFANRGPAVRWLAPGDDVAYPFSARERLFHAESSGASAIAAGVALLVLACNRSLRHSQVHALLLRTVDPPERDDAFHAALADPADVLPAGHDADGHNARCGYGRLNAARACACARDPIALELIAMGEASRAGPWLEGARPYSPRLARWAVRRLLARPELEHAVRAILRHARLVGAEPARANAHGPGALGRQVALVVRDLLASRPPPRVRQELAAAAEVLRSPSEEVDASLQTAILRLFGGSPPQVPAGLGVSVSTTEVQS